MKSHNITSISNRIFISDFLLPPICLRGQSFKNMYLKCLKIFESPISQIDIFRPMFNGYVLAPVVVLPFYNMWFKAIIDWKRVINVFKVENYD